MVLEEFVFFKTLLIHEQLQFCQKDENKFVLISFNAHWPGRLHSVKKTSSKNKFYSGNDE